MKYSFILKDNNQRAYKLFTWFLFFLHVGAAAFALNTNDTKVKLTIYILLGFYALIISVYYFYRKNPRAQETFSLIMALLYANFWFQQVGIIAMLVFGAVYILVTVVKGKSTTVVFSVLDVQLTRVFKTVVFSWTAMENVVLKDNILTIDFKSNKIIQAEILTGSRLVDETEFNHFCNGQIQLPSVTDNPGSG